MNNLINWLNLASLPGYVQLIIAILSSVLAFLIARGLVARGLVYLAKRSKNQVDDMLVKYMRPYRFAWIAPFLVLYAFTGLLPQGTNLIKNILLFFILWISLITLNSLLDAVNAIYESSAIYHGESIQGYLDLAKVFLVIVGLILTGSLFTGQSPIVLLSGVGAMMALVLLIFRDTLLSFVASMQINSHDLVKEGDWIEMPAYEADGDVINIALHTVKVQNWNKTFTVIPTYKFLDTPYRNWRGMTESGGRRIKRAIYIDLNSVRFCTRTILERLRKNELVQNYIDRSLAECELEMKNQGDLDIEQQLTNVGIYRAYMTEYLMRHPDLHHEKMTLLVRQLPPGPNGLPLEVYVFTTTTSWESYENIQAEIFEHLIAALPEFDLQIFQQPTGVDFRALSGSDQSGILSA
jgi:miniconductance mechanosensitive channel